MTECCANSSPLQYAVQAELPADTYGLESNIATISNQKIHENWSHGLNAIDLEIQML